MQSANKKPRSSKLDAVFCCHFAEEEGFEPPVPCSTTVFKTAAIDHSAIPPKGIAKVVKNYSFAKNFQ